MRLRLTAGQKITVRHMARGFGVVGAAIVGAAIIAGLVLVLRPPSADAADFLSQSGRPQSAQPSSRASIQSLTTSISRDRLIGAARSLESRRLSLESRERVLTTLPQDGPTAASLRSIDRQVDQLGIARRAVSAERRALERDASLVQPLIQRPIIVPVDSVGGSIPGLSRDDDAGSAAASEAARGYVQDLVERFSQRWADGGPADGD